MDNSDLSKISFVHNALPDLALNKIEIGERINGIALKSPIFVFAKSADNAKELSLNIRDTPVLCNSKKNVWLYLNGAKRKFALNGYRLVRIRDGIEAAKAIRLGKNIPFVDEKDAIKLDVYIKQLQVAMFLTNSGSLRALKKAPVYKMI